MTALIQSLVNGATPVVGQSRNDLRAGDVIQLDAINPATNYAWSIAFAPEDKNNTPSAAVLAGNIFSNGPVTFTVDYSGAYLIRLVVDAGLPTQDEQYVRLRFETVFGDLKLVAAGERRDGTGIIPVDVSAEGWANDQNYNLKTLLCLIQHSAASGRIVYVDANRGKDSNNVPNDPTIAEGWADFSTVGAAILAAQSNAAFNGGMPPTLTQPMIVAVRPGRYIEDITFAPFVHVIGWPQMGAAGAHPDGDRSVVLRCANVAGATHTASIPSLGEFCMVSNVMLENTGSTTNPLVQKSGEGDVYWINSMFLQEGTGAINQGATYAALRGGSSFRNCRLIQTDTFTDTSEVFLINPAPGQTASIEMFDSRLRGTSLGSVDPNQAGGSLASFVDCEFEQVGTAAGNFAIQTWGLDLALDGCVMSVDSGGFVLTAIEANLGGLAVAGNLVVRVRRSILGDSDLPTPSYLGIRMNPINVGGTTTLQLGSSEYGTITAPLPVVRRALTLGTSLFYDNTITGLLTAENVQDAIDDIAGAAFAAVSLNAAYNIGRIITADADAVEIHGTPLSTTLPPVAPLAPTGDGVLRVYNQIEVGAINDWEILAAPNWFGNGPSILGGNLNWNTDSEIGSAFAIYSLPSGPLAFTNFNLRIAAADGLGDTFGAHSDQMGNVWVRGGHSLCGSGVNAASGGDVAIIAGGVDEAVAISGLPGNIWLHPGFSMTPAAGAGTINVVDASTATPATLTAPNLFADLSTNPAGTLTFATAAGRVDVVFPANISFAAMASLFLLGTGMSATLTGGPNFQLTSSVRGPDAEILLIEDSTGALPGSPLNQYLGDLTKFGGAAFVKGTYPDFVALQSTGSEILQVGTTLPMIYDGTTGKLTVPGLIDPTGMVFDEYGEGSIPTGANKGAIFVSDGTGGAGATNALYYKDEGGGLTNLLLGGGGGAPTNLDYLTFSDETPTLTNSLQIVGTGGEINFLASGSTYVASLFATGVVANTYNHADITVDSKGRITSAFAGTKTISRQMMIPLGVTIPPDFDVCEFDFFAESFTPTGVWVYLETAFVGVVAADIQLDVLGRGAATVPGVQSSFFAAPVNIGALPATQGSFIPLTAAPGTLSGPVVIQIFVKYTNGAPTAGGGLVVSVVGTL